MGAVLSLAVAPDVVGNDAVGNDARGHDAIGSDAIAHAAVANGLVADTAPLDAVLRDPRIYRRGTSTAAADGVPSGLAALDRSLPWGGFPRGALTEVLLAHDGLGELGLLLPMLARLDAALPIVFVSPPYLPYAPALAAAGLAPERIVEVRTPAERALWAAEQCLRAGCCGAVLAWHDGGDDRALRRLQVAAEAGRGIGVLFRPLRHAANASPAALRLALDAGSGQSRLRVVKCRGAVTPPAPIAVPRSPFPLHTTACAAVR